MSNSTVGRISGLVLGVLLLVGCLPAARPMPTASPSPVASPSAAPSGAVIVTFSVVDEEYRILLRDPAQVEIARRLLAGDEAPSIPNGLIVPGDPGVNSPWSWHIDPDSVEFADFTMEVCDGKPSDVENGALTSERFCPWSAEVVEVTPAEAGE